MSGKCYPEAFKIKVVKQVIERGHSVSSVATRLDITIHSLYAWIKPPHSRRHHVDLNLGSSGWNRAVFMVIARSVSICWISGTMRCKQSLVVDATCGDKGSGRIPKSTGAWRFILLRSEEANWRSQGAYLVSNHLEFIDYFSMRFLSVPPIMPPHVFPCQLTG